MSQITGSLGVNGATLYYRCYGSGPPLLLIHASGSSADAFDQLACALAGCFRVIAYDRRGHGRSSPADTQASPAVARHAEDALRLLDALDAGPAHVFGTSAGAVIALDLAARYSAALRTVVVHEPPAVPLLPDAEALRISYDAVHRTYLSEGAGPAAATFLAIAGAQKPPPSVLARLAADFDAGFAAELLPITTFVPDLPVLRTSMINLVPASGSAPPISVGRRAVEVLARSLGKELVRFPGNHWGYVHAQQGNDPVAFAGRLAEIMRADGRLTGAGEACPRRSTYGQRAVSGLGDDGFYHAKG